MNTLQKVFFFFPQGIGCIRGITVVLCCLMYVLFLTFKPHTQLCTLYIACGVAGSLPGFFLASFPAFGTLRVEITLI